MYGRPNPSGDRLGIVNPEGDFSPDVSGQPPLERLAPGQRQDRVQHRPDLAGVDQPRDLDELGPARLDDEEDPAGPGVPGRLGRRLGRYGDERPAAAPEDAQERSNVSPPIVSSTTSTSRSTSSNRVVR